ncbi:Gfo/Idh/MocA family protein [Luedemannella helvata]|uniref:Gfo/Idh/MocA-like oxidoreductase N-terminal domain-containing protein n=1 Tax=Luedemannella helvata TaxID=349315 RepID=A0ABN2JSY3_9ACTN
MRVLQIGAGSMGTRRLRDLHQRPGLTLTVLDQRPDRRARAAERFGVATVATLDEAWGTTPDVLIISTPPNEHDRYIAAALKRDLHFFCEADIWSYDHRRVEEATARSGRVAAPSCTLYFNPFVRELRRVVAEELGTLHAFGYVLSVDAPSWHPGEGAEYYARHRATAPAREMVPFELIALGHVFGHATAASGRVVRRGGLDLEGEDTWSLQLALEGGATGQLTVVMAVPAPVRQGWAVGDRGAIRFDLLTGVLERMLPGGAGPTVETVCDWTEVYESMYDAEMTAFLAAVRGEAPWPYPYRTAARVCATLAAAELSMRSGRTEPVELHRQPAPLPVDYPRG